MYIFIAILIILLGFVLYFSKTSKPNIITIKCPEDYPNTDAGFEAKKVATDDWVASFRKNNPNASLDDFAKARARFYIDNNCNTTLENYYESTDSESDTEEEKVMRAIIKEEIDKEGMKNLIDGLKNQ